MTAEETKWLLLLMQMVLFGAVWMIEDRLYKTKGYYVNLLGQKFVEGDVPLWKKRLRSGLLAISFAIFWLVYASV